MVSLRKKSDDLGVLVEWADAGESVDAELAFALDALDMFPDHFKGIGIADDAIVLRLASKLAFAAGSKHPTVEALAVDANLVIALFDDLAAPLERLVSQFPDREVRGRNAAKILASKDVRVAFDADIGREAKRQVAAPVSGTDTPERTVIELRKMLEAAIKRAGLV